MFFRIAELEGNHPGEWCAIRKDDLDKLIQERELCHQALRWILRLPNSDKSLRKARAFASEAIRKNGLFRPLIQQPKPPIAYGARDLIQVPLVNCEVGVVSIQR